MYSKSWHLCCEKCAKRCDFHGWDMHKPEYCHCGGKYLDFSETSKPEGQLVTVPLAPYVPIPRQERSSNPKEILADLYERWPEFLGG
jgi:hypothetical protein